MKYVRYVGLSHARIITAQDWRSVGIDGDTVVWSAQNGFAVPTDAFTDEQMRKAIDPDPEFIVTTEDFTPTPQNRDMTPGQVVQATESPVDVFALANGDADTAPATSEASGGRPAGNPDADSVPDDTAKK